MATWQAAEPGTVVGDGQGNYQIRVAGQWTPMPKGSLIADEHGAYHFDASAIKPPAAAPAPDATGAANAEAAKHEQGPVQDVIDMVHSGIVHVPAALKGLVDSLKGDPLHNPDIAGNLRNLIHTVTNPGETLSSVGQTLSNATPQQVGANVVAPLLAGAGAGKVVGALGGAGEAAAAPAAVTKYGLRTGAENPIARNVAGESARPAVTAHNQGIADPTIGAQAGVAPGTPLNAANLETARAAPNSVYERAGAAIPTGPLSPGAAQMVQNVGADDLVVHSPDTQATVAAQKARLLGGDLSGPQVVDAQKALRFNGFKNITSEDPEQLALGRAQLKMADALHQHMVDTIPANADVSADQLTAARTALAQNHTVEGLLKGGKVDLQALARFGRNNPGLLTGPLKDFAEFADQHPEVSSLPSNAERFNPSGILKDVGGISLTRPVGSIAQVAGGHFARRALTRARPPIAQPVTGLGGEFGPIDRTPQPPPGMTASPPSAPPTAGAGPPGQIPLADLLSHGVEQPPAAGLSVAPGGPAPASGVPFSPNLEHAAGGLELAPEHTFGGAPANNSDLGAVMSQGVPEGIVQRSRPAHFVANNDSISGPASLEAQARPKLNLEMVDQDGRGMPILKDVTQGDVEPLSGHVIVDADTGRIVKSGTMKPSLARNLLARWKTMRQEPTGTALGAEFEPSQ